ncbi:hypothetical protein [Methanopyrus kandleri]|jgi:uncharacterized membrane protein
MKVSGTELIRELIMELRALRHEIHMLRMELEKLRSEVDEVEPDDDFSELLQQSEHVPEVVIEDSVGPDSVAGERWRLL